VRNLSGTDAGGRPLRIDLADTDPSLEGKTTVRGELVDAADLSDSRWRTGSSTSSLSSSASFTFSSPNSSFSSATSSGSSAEDAELSAFLASLPEGKDLPRGMSSMDAISQALAAMPPGQLIEVLAQMKVNFSTLQNDVHFVKPNPCRLSLSTTPHWRDIC
jgi:cleavage stimulation factor subunit 2